MGTSVNMAGFEAFTEEVLEGLRKDYGQGYRIELHKAQKNNGVVLTGACIRKKEENTAPIIYLEPYYKACRGKDAAGEAVKKIRDAERNVKRDAYIPRELKSRVIFRIVNEDRNREILKDAPHISLSHMGLCGLAMVFCLDFESTDGIHMAARIENRHLEAAGADEEELYRLAMENTPKLLPDILMDMDDMLREMEGHVDIPKDSFRMDALPMYILTNTSTEYGAGALLYPGLLEALSREKGTGFIILPSSVHEAILLPYEEGMDFEKLREMVWTVNRTEVAPEDFLSDNVYFYDREKNESTDFAIRRQHLPHSHPVSWYWSAYGLYSHQKPC